MYLAANYPLKNFVVWSIMKMEDCAETDLQDDFSGAIYCFLRPVSLLRPSRELSDSSILAATRSQSYSSDLLAI